MIWFYYDLCYGCKGEKECSFNKFKGLKQEIEVNKGLSMENRWNRQKGAGNR